MSTSRAPKADHTFRDPRKVLAEHGLSPKRGFSQSFLTSRGVVERIARAAELRAGETVVELGAGLGTLTSALIATGARVIAVERDRELAPVLRAELGDAATVVEADAATLDLAALRLPGEAEVCVVGNLPYAITGAILQNLHRQREVVARAVLMVQLEVAERLLARPGSAEYGALSVFTQAGFEVRRVTRVAPGSFHPPPRVHSAVIHLRRLQPPRAVERDAFRRVVRAAFQARRKTLRNALAPLGMDAEALLRAAGIDPRRRGETLDVEELDALACAVEAHSDDAGGDGTPDSANT